MPGIRDFGIISELGWDYDVKLFEDGPPILKIVMARDMGSSKVTSAYTHVRGCDVLRNPIMRRPASKLAGRRDTPKGRWRGEGWGEVREYFAYLQCKSC